MFFVALRNCGCIRNISATLKDVKFTSRKYSKVSQTEKMKLSGLRRVSFLLAMVYTVSTIRTRRHGCICGDSKSDLNICGCGPSVSGVVVKAANLQKLSPVHIPLSRGKPYKFDCRCPHCSGFLGSSGSSRTSFGTWKYGHNRFHQLFNK